MNRVIFAAVCGLGIVGSLFAARHEQLGINELTVETIIYDGTEITATADEINTAGDVVTVAGTSTGASIVLPEGTDNGVNTTTIQGPTSATTNNTITLPDDDVDLGVIVAGGVLPAVDGRAITGVALDTEVWGEAGIVESTNELVNTVAIQAKDIAGNDLSGYRVLHVWISETDVGVASTNNIETLALTTGTAVSTVTAHADYWYATASDGSAVATVTATAAGTNYLMVVDGSVISSAALTFE